MLLPSLEPYFIWFRGMGPFQHTDFEGNCQSRSAERLQPDKTSIYAGCAGMIDPGHQHERNFYLFVILLTEFHFKNSEKALAPGGFGRYTIRVSL